MLISQLDNELWLAVGQAAIVISYTKILVMIHRSLERQVSCACRD